jgi:enoyl-[acyl-carrier-protein] reductase (NADH)
VNAVSPNFIPTPLVMDAMAVWFPGRSDDERQRIVRDMNAMDGPVLEAQDVARAALFLTSDEAKYVNGHNLIVDGGFTASKVPKYADNDTVRRIGPMDSIGISFRNNLPCFALDCPACRDL